MILWIVLIILAVIVLVVTRYLSDSDGGGGNTNGGGVHPTPAPPGPPNPPPPPSGCPNGCPPGQVCVLNQCMVPSPPPPPPPPPSGCQGGCPNGQICYGPPGSDSCQDLIAHATLGETTNQYQNLFIYGAAREPLTGISNVKLMVNGAPWTATSCETRAYSYDPTYGSNGFDCLYNSPITKGATYAFSATATSATTSQDFTFSGTVN